ncbi:MAG: hypothetical protein NTX50_08695 [Candidatus Sumerlaeota bacterium]|nr:hypothetical protein [Candidatus Sumerlaeota bacterium]
MRRLSMIAVIALLGAMALFNAVAGFAAEPAGQRILTIDFSREAGVARPSVGFLGGLRDSMPDELIRPLHPTLWRIGHQFRGRIAKGLPGAIDRVESLGAVYKLVMSDLIGAKPADFAKYEADVKKLVAETGTRASRIIWEPVNEPDISHKPIEKYYELYEHAFKALREAEPQAQICGPSFAYPSYDKYKAFLDYCREHKLECNYLAWHYTGWDPAQPEKAKWQLGRMREFIENYKDQKIREIHCDEWGAGPDKPSIENPGRLQPGRAVVWFHYLENVYIVDRACRANWGKADDYLGGIVSPQSEPYPVFHVYRWYGSMAGQTRVPVSGCDGTLACLASKSSGSCELIVGYIGKSETAITLELKNALGLKNTSASKFKQRMEVINTGSLATPMLADKIPSSSDYGIESAGDSIRITLPKVAENEAYHLVLIPSK